MIFAHYNEETNEKQTLYDHLSKTADIMRSQNDTLQFSAADKKLFESFLSDVGMYHDIGKATRAFQQYITEKKYTDDKNHSFPSAVCFAAMCEYDNYLKYMGMSAIASHHGHIDLITSDKNDFVWDNISDKIEKIHKGCVGDTLLCDGFCPSEYDEDSIDECLKQRRRILKKDKNTQNFFLLQYVFSKLVYADKLDSSGAERCIPTAFSLCKTEQYIKNNSKQSDINSSRSEIRRIVMDNIASLSDEQIENNRIFTITAPTGTGKTLTGISAAIMLSERINKLYDCKCKIITAIPFINIIEQTKDVYREIFDDVLTHYSMDITTADTAIKDLLAEAWENNVILTTFVQFFESVLTDKNKKLMKLNRYANAVVILDEVQSIDEGYYGLIGCVIYFLSRYYGTRFILMTATKPEIIRCANNLMENNNAKAYELLDNYEKFYKALDRTRLIPRKDINSIDSLCSLIAQTKNDFKSALVVVNTIAHCAEVYQALKKEGYDVLYLSTNITSTDRRKVIEKAKKKIDSEDSFILVSTQTIEAGVDLDFDIGYRDMAPLSSIIQTAGRVNRSGKKGHFCPVYIFDTGKCKTIYSYSNINNTDLLTTEEITEDNYLELITKYYEKTTGVLTPSVEFYQAILSCDYSTISQFSLIKNTDNITVIVQTDNKAVRLCEELCSLMKEDKNTFDKRCRIKNKLREINMYTVSIRRSSLKCCISDFKDIYDGIDLPYKVVPIENLNEYYTETGLKRTPNGDEMF